MLIIRWIKLTSCWPFLCFSQAYQRLQIQQQMMQAQRNVSGPIRQQEQQVSQRCCTVCVRCVWSWSPHRCHVTPCEHGQKVAFAILALIWWHHYNNAEETKELLHISLRKPDGIFMGTCGEVASSIVRLPPTQKKQNERVLLFGSLLKLRCSSLILPQWFSFESALYLWLCFTLRELEVETMLAWKKLQWRNLPNTKGSVGVAISDGLIVQMHSKANWISAPCQYWLLSKVALMHYTTSDGVTVDPYRTNSNALFLSFFLIIKCVILYWAFYGYRQCWTTVTISLEH